MPSPESDEEDIHNPFGGSGGQKLPKKKEEPGIFDPEYKGSEDDPFLQTPGERDSVWDEDYEETGTKDA